MKDGLEPRGHILVVGGGASGVLMAAHLLAQSDLLRVTLIEKGDLLGCGIAYSTTNPDHLLNTRVHNMSAFPDQPAHFHEWLGRHGDDTGPNGFVSRTLYGQYMNDLLTPWQDGDRLVTIKGDCLRLDETPSGILATLADGRTVAADRAVLATGHAVPPATDSLSNAWTFSEATDPDARVVIIGSGLSMIDQAVSLLKSGHRGQIVSVSRRGLLPRSHGNRVPKKRVLPPRPEKVSDLLAWAREVAEDCEADGGSWRDAVDSIRHQVHEIWRGLSTEQRSRFIRHAAPWWDVHRHRMPPASWALISDAVAQGQLVIRRGAFEHSEGHIARIRRRDGSYEDIPAERIIDCRGILRDLETNATPLIRDLLQRGAARQDALRIGLDVGLDCHLIGRDGVPRPNILAIGPVSRAAFWEITAIPDIREQTARLAGTLASEKV